MQDKFFQLLRYSIGASEQCPEIATVEWPQIFIMAQQQSLLGILFDGVQRLPFSTMDRHLLLKWYAIGEQIRVGNEKTNQVAVKVSRYFLENDFRSCILKGQGNTLDYPNPYIRSSGDIDLWVSPLQHSKMERLTRSVGKGLKMRTVNCVNETIVFVRKKCPNAEACYHHVDAGTCKGIEVEVHYRPSFMNNLIHNGRLQKWFEEKADEEFSHEVELPDDAGKVCVPTNAFNRIYQLAHINHHIIHEGIGLRQIIDYYFLLKQGFTEEERAHDERLLKHLGLYKVASAVMYVLNDTLGLEEKCLLVAPNEKLGRFLLDEIMLSGNFGQYDKRVKHGASPWEKNLQRLQRDWRLVWYFPSECLWEPIFRWYHFFWRLAHR